MRPLTAAALQLAPHPGPLTANSVAENLNRAVGLIERCVGATGAELLVLPESVTTGFTPGIDTEELWDLVSELPGPTSAPVAGRAASSASTWCWAPTSAAPERGVVYNAAVVLGPAGELLGVYRKTHPFGTERADRGGWVTPGEDIWSSTPRSAGSA